MSEKAKPETITETVALVDVERALLRHLKTFQGTGQEPVARACMSNLVVYCEKPELAFAVAAALPEIVALHPSRVFLLMADPESKGGELETSVTVRALPAGNGRKLFVEQINLHAQGVPAIQKLPFVVRALVIGDLPMNLWWATASPPPTGGVLFHDLSEPAEQVIYDSIGWPDPLRGLTITAGWIGQLEQVPRPTRWRLASDLNWRRLKPWRRLLAQALDPVAAPGYLESIAEVYLEHGPRAVVQAVELVGWLAARLSWKVQGGKVKPGVEMAWNFENEQGGPIKVRVRRLEQGAAAIQQVKIACKPGGLTLETQEDRRLAVIPAGEGIAPRTLTAPPLTVPEMVGRQLSDRERDPIFRASMDMARLLAQSALES